MLHKSCLIVVSSSIYFLVEQHIAMFRLWQHILIVFFCQCWCLFFTLVSQPSWLSPRCRSWPAKSRCSLLWRLLPQWHWQKALWLSCLSSQSFSFGWAVCLLYNSNMMVIYQLNSKFTMLTFVYICRICLDGKTSFPRMNWSSFLPPSSAVESL